jgi:hypothetical protein
MGSWPYSSFISSETQIGGHGDWNDHHGKFVLFGISHCLLFSFHHSSSLFFKCLYSNSIKFSGHSYERNTHEDVAALPRDLLSSAPGSEEDASSLGKADIDNKALDTKNNRNNNRKGKKKQAAVGATRKRNPKPRPKKHAGAIEEKEASQNEPNADSADVVEKKSTKKPRGKPQTRKPRPSKLSAQKEVEQHAAPEQQESEPRSESAIKDSKPRRKPRTNNNRANTGKTEKEIDKPKEPKAQKKRRPRKPEVASTNE